MICVSQYGLRSIMIFQDLSGSILTLNVCMGEGKHALCVWAVSSVERLRIVRMLAAVLPISQHLSISCLHF